MNNSSDSPAICDSNNPHVSVLMQGLITSFYVLGIGGNISALVILTRNETSRNKKQTLMLRCLACNDLIALLGSFVLMYVQLYLQVEELARSKSMCAVRVFWRTFGLGSGSVAVVMTIERCLALTNPFVYQKHITFTWIKSSIFGLWFIATIIVCLPFVGFGLYFDEECRKCMRYRNATSAKDIVYAYVVVVFGLLMCICIVCCNFAVVGVLCGIQKPSNSRHLVRIRRSTTKRKKKKSASSDGDIYQDYATQEEIAFAKLMAILSIFFVVCWFPQMLVVIVCVSMDPDMDSEVFRLADVCIALNFTLDPFVYVIFRRQQRRGICRKLKRLCQSCRVQSTTHRVASDSDLEKNIFALSDMSKSSKGSQINRGMNSSFSRS